MVYLKSLNNLTSAFDTENRVIINDNKYLTNMAHIWQQKSQGT